MDADSEAVIVLLAVVDVIRLRDVDKSSVPLPPSPSRSPDVCLVCLVLVLLAVTATEVAVLAMLPCFETAGDVRGLLDEMLATVVLSLVSADVLSIVWVFSVVLGILIDTVLATSRVRSAVIPLMDILVDADPVKVVALLTAVDEYSQHSNHNHSNQKSIRHN